MFKFLKALLPYTGPRETQILSRSPVVTVTETRDHYRNAVTRAALPVTASIYTA
jgi:hypothetical protein